jgi:hypothetical protein
MAVPRARSRSAERATITPQAPDMGRGARAAASARDEDDS